MFNTLKTVGVAIGKALLYFFFGVAILCAVIVFAFAFADVFTFLSLSVTEKRLMIELLQLQIDSYIL